MTYPAPALRLEGTLFAVVDEVSGGMKATMAVHTPNCGFLGPYYIYRLTRASVLNDVLLRGCTSIGPCSTKGGLS